MAAPALTGLSGRFPDAKIDLLIREEFAGLGKLFPFVSRVFPLPRARGEQRRLMRSLRDEGYDTGVALPNSFRSAWRMWRANISYRIGYAGDFRSPLLTHPAPKPARHSVSQRDYYFLLLREVWPGLKAGEVKLIIPQQAREKAERLLGQGGKPLIGMGFGASYGSAKMWPSERFSDLADRLSETAEVVLFGAEADREAEREILRLARSRPKSLVGATDIPTLAAAFSMLDLYITNDTGPMSLADAVGAKVLAIFGPTSPEETGPRGEGAAIIRHEVDCAPCWRRKCPTDHRCMTFVTVEDVHAAAMKELGAGG